MQRLRIICEDDIFGYFGLFFSFPVVVRGEPHGELKHLSLAGANLEAGVGAVGLGAGSLLVSLLEV